MVSPATETRAVQIRKDLPCLKAFHMDSISENPGELHVMEFTAPYKDPLLSFIFQKEYSVHRGQTVSLPSTQVSVIKE